MPRTGDKYNLLVKTARSPVAESNSPLRHDKRQDMHWDIGLARERATGRRIMAPRTVIPLRRGEQVGTCAARCRRCDGSLLCSVRRFKTQRRPPVQGVSDDPR